MSLARASLGIRQRPSRFECVTIGSHIARPCFSTFSVLRQRETSSVPTRRNPRWLSEQKDRLGKCITFGLEPSQVERAGGIARSLATKWEGLVAGADGFLVKQKVGNEAWEEKVLWGEMVCLLADQIAHDS